MIRNIQIIIGWDSSCRNLYKSIAIYIFSISVSSSWPESGQVGKRSMPRMFSNVFERSSRKIENSSVMWKKRRGGSWFDSQFGSCDRKRERDRDREKDTDTETEKDWFSNKPSVEKILYRFIDQVDHCAAFVLFFSLFR